MAIIPPQLNQPNLLLNHILDRPEFVDNIRNLEPGVLNKLIHHIGLEDSGELVSLATVEQLERIFDEDLWRSDKPGEDETFDAERFALWLEIMLESGAALTARKVACLDEDLVTLAFCKLILVIDLDDLSLRMSNSRRPAEDDLLDKQLDNCLGQDFDEYLVISKDHRSWESICAVLVELNEQNYSLLTRLLERCCNISSEYIEDNGGLYDVLKSEEMLESDLAGQREERRESRGFVSPSTAAGFLGSIRMTSLQEIIDSNALDPVTRAYFRAARAGGESEAKERAAAEASSEGTSDRRFSKTIRLLRTLTEDEVLAAPFRGNLIESGESRDGQLLLTQAIRAIKVRDDKLYKRIVEQLSFLSNVLIAGCGYAGRRFRPVEALEASLAICNIGSEHILGITSADQQFAQVKRVQRLLEDQNLVKLFKAGWKILHSEVSLYAARALQNILRRIGEKIKGRPQSRQLNRIASALEAKVSAEKPWLLRSELDQLADFMDGPTATALTALFSEFPTLPAGIGERESARKSPFISTLGQVQAIQRLLKQCGVASRDNRRISSN